MVEVGTRMCGCTAFGVGAVARRAMTMLGTGCLQWVNVKIKIDVLYSM